MNGDNIHIIPRINVGNNYGGKTKMIERKNYDIFGDEIAPDKLGRFDTYAVVDADGRRWVLKQNRLIVFVKPDAFANYLKLLRAEKVDEAMAFAAKYEKESLKSQSEAKVIYGSNAENMSAKWRQPPNEGGRCDD